MTGPRRLIKDSNDCINAADAMGNPFGGVVNRPFSLDRPRGCYFDIPSRKVWFNAHETGKN